ncbi:MAG: DUF5615 family PIN-like protein [Magnetococcus sp. YQC-3]
MRYLIDAQLPPALARSLVELARQAEHVLDVGLIAADDLTIWSYAIRTGATIITKDDDFIKRSHLIADSPPIVWVRLGNTGNKQLLARFGKLLPAIEAALAAGEKIVEVV